MSAERAQKRGRERNQLEPEVHLQKAVKGVITCLFFGKTAQVLQLTFRKGKEHPNTTSYPLEAFESPTLDDELECLEEILQISCDNNNIFRMPVGYVHVYTDAINNSALTLTTAHNFFTFTGEVARVPLSEASNIDVNPFLRPDAVLQIRGVERESAVESAAVVPWDWNEVVWVERLFKCLEQQLTDITVVPAFQWKPINYRTDISTLFKHVKDLQATPFKGMTDILLIGQKNVAVVRVEELTVVCSVEATCTVTVAGEIKKWPEKLGELLASMYWFGTLNYLNNLRNMPTTDTIGWTTYGVFAIRTLGFMILRMKLDHTGCGVTLIQEGAMPKLGSAMEYVVRVLKTSD